MSVLSGGRGGHSQNVLCFDLAKNALECKSREMMAFVDDGVAVLGYKIMNYALVLQALDYSDVDRSGSLVLSSPELPNVVDGHSQKGRKALAPLVHQLTSMYENQRADTSPRNKAGSDHRLSKCGRSAKYSLIMSQQLSDRVVLFSSQFSVKRNIDVLSCSSFILNLGSDSMSLE